MPVRIEFDAGQDMRRLRAGMSANVEIDTRRQRSLAGAPGPRRSCRQSALSGPMSAATRHNEERSRDGRCHAGDDAGYS